MISSIPSPSPSPSPSNFKSNPELDFLEAKLETALGKKDWITVETAIGIWLQEDEEGAEALIESIIQDLRKTPEDLEAFSKLVIELRPNLEFLFVPDLGT